MTRDIPLVQAGAGGTSTQDPELDRDVRHLLELLLVTRRRATVTDPLATACVALELSPAQLYAVLWLRADGVLAMGELARRIGVTEKTLTGIVDRLETAGFVRRERDLDDRRVVRVHATDAGSALSAKAEDVIHATFRELLGRLDSADRSDLFRIIGKLTGEPDRRAPETP